MSEIDVEINEMSATAEVSIDYDSLATTLLSYVEDNISDMIRSIADDAVESALYDWDISDQIYDGVRNQISDSLNDEIGSLLDDVTPSSLCSTGAAFKNAIETIMVHHLNVVDVINENLSATGKELMVNFEVRDKPVPPPEETVVSDLNTDNTASDGAPPVINVTTATNVDPEDQIMNAS